MLLTAPTGASTVNHTCPHTPTCPPAAAGNHDEAVVVARYPEQGWELLCNGVIVFEDTGELAPDGTSVAPHRAAAPHSATRLTDSAAALRPTSARLAFLVAVAAGNVVRRTWSNGNNNGQDINLRTEHLVNWQVQRMQQAGWIRLQKQTWAAPDVVTTRGMELRYWETTIDGEAVLRRAGIHVPEHWTANARARHGVSIPLSRVGETPAAGVDLLERPGDGH